ncbi:unnamed protein product [Aphanomyces euteiches]
MFGYARFRCVAFSAGDIFAAVDEKGRVFAFFPLRNRYALVCHLGTPALECAFSPQQRTELLVTCEDLTVRCVDVHSKTLVSTLRGHRQIPTCVAFQRPGQLALTASADAVIMWDSANWSRFRTLNAGPGVEAAQFVGNGELVAVCFKDDSILMWELSTLALHYRFTLPEYEHAPGLKRFCVSENCQVIVASGETPFIYVWEFESQTLIRIIELPATVQRIVEERNRIASEEAAIEAKRNLLAQIESRTRELEQAHKKWMNDKAQVLEAEHRRRIESMQAEKTRLMEMNILHEQTKERRLKQIALMEQKAREALEESSKVLRAEHDRWMDELHMHMEKEKWRNQQQVDEEELVRLELDAERRVTELTKDREREERLQSMRIEFFAQLREQEIRDQMVFDAWKEEDRRAVAEQQSKRQQMESKQQEREEAKLRREWQAKFEEQRLQKERQMQLLAQDRSMRPNPTANNLDDAESEDYTNATNEYPPDRPSPPTPTSLTSQGDETPPLKAPSQQAPPHQPQQRTPPLQAPSPQAPPHLRQKRPGNTSQIEPTHAPPPQAREAHPHPAQVQSRTPAQISPPSPSVHVTPGVNSEPIDDVSARPQPPKTVSSEHRYYEGTRDIGDEVPPLVQDLPSPTTSYLSRQSLPQVPPMQARPHEAARQQSSFQQAPYQPIPQSLPNLSAPLQKDSKESSRISYKWSDRELLQHALGELSSDEDEGPVVRPRALPPSQQMSQLEQDLRAEFSDLSGSDGAESLEQRPLSELERDLEDLIGDDSDDDERSTSPRSSVDLKSLFAHVNQPPVQVSVPAPPPAPTTLPDRDRLTETTRKLLQLRSKLSDLETMAKQTVPVEVEEKLDAGASGDKAEHTKLLERAKELLQQHAARLRRETDHA